MGLRRLRGRLDQVQGRTNETLGMAQDLLADFQDGFAVTVEVDETAAATIAKMILRGQAGTLPLRIKIDPKVDA